MRSDTVAARANIVLTHICKGSAMQVAIRKMGNSQGVVIPKPLLPLGLQVKNRMIEIRPLLRAPRTNWAQDSQRLAAIGDDSLVWPEWANEGDQDLGWCCWVSCALWTICAWHSVWALCSLWCWKKYSALCKKYLRLKANRPNHRNSYGDWGVI